jgi:hypothetical protein
VRACPVHKHTTLCADVAVGKNNEGCSLFVLNDGGLDAVWNKVMDEQVLRVSCLYEQLSV